MRTYKQKMIAIIVFLAAILVLYIAATGDSPRDCDATAVVFMIPISLWLFFSKEKLI